MLGPTGRRSCNCREPDWHKWRGTGRDQPVFTVTTRDGRQEPEKGETLGLEPMAQTKGFGTGTPNGIRTRAATLRGWCPRPLDDGGRTTGYASDATGTAKNRIPADHYGRSLWRA